MKKIALPFTTVLLMLFILVSGCQDASNSESESTLPNFILIIADDLSWNDLGAYGHPHIRTPHLDRMAREGMRFDQAFLTTSSCSPSRSSIITGLYPHNTDAEQLHWPLPADRVTFVEKLKEAGYWTGQAGKWHLGEDVKDRFHEVRDVGTIGFVLSPEGESLPPEGDGSGSEHWLSLLRDRPANQPFFLWLAAVDPHRPYEEGIIDPPHTNEDVIVPPYMPDTPEVREDLALYYDEISRLDRYVGAVLDELENQGVADNTMVLFMGDNGRPFQRDKTTLLDGGIKTPWIVKWPARVAPGTTTTSLVSSIDIAPTLLSLAQQNIPETFEGVDFGEILSDPALEVRDHIYAEDHWHDHDDFGRAVRNHQFKYIRNFFPELANTPPADALTGMAFKATLALHKQGQLTPEQALIFQAPRPEEELYDVEADPHELINLAGDPAYAAALDSMRVILASAREASGDRDPEFRTPDEFDRTTGEPNALRERPRPSKQEIRSRYLESIN